MLPRSHRLHASKDYNRVHRTGRRVASGWLTLVWSSRKSGGVRIGVVVPNSTARHAVRRNALKRKMRAVIARIRQEIPAGTDVILTARSYPVSLAISSIQAQILKIFRDAFRAGSTARPGGRRLVG